jgi:hypothetical protein
VENDDTNTNTIVVDLYGSDESEFCRGVAGRGIYDPRNSERQPKPESIVFHHAIIRGKDYDR